MPLGYPDRQRLWEWLQHEAPVDHKLLWCRTVDAYAFRDAVERDGCDPHQCEVFGEALIYLFYGRPAFRIAEDDIAIGHSYPVVLVFENELVDKATRMFPFDSGAFAGKRYSDFMHKRMTLGNFELPVSPEAPRKMVSAFFGSNFEYLRTVPRRPERNHKAEFEVEALVRMYLQGRPKADDRRQVVELQVPVRLDLSEAYWTALVYPDHFEDSKWFKSFVSKLPSRVELLPYPAYGDKIAKEYQTTLEGEVERLHRGRGLK